MANIPKLGAKTKAQATTRTLDRSGVLNQELSGLKQTSQFVQGLIKTGVSQVKEHIYESESSKSEDDVVAFVSEIKDPLSRQKYLKENGGNIAGFHTSQAQKNLDLIRKMTDKYSSKKAKKELEKKLTFQLEKNLLADRDYEMRLVSAESQAKEEKRNATMAVEISNMKTPGSRQEYNSTVLGRLGDLQNSVNTGSVDPKKAVGMKKDIVNTAAASYASALVEGGNSLEALKYVKEKGSFATPQAFKTSLNYVKSKHLDGYDKAYKLEQQQNKLIREKLKAQEVQIDLQVQSIQDDPNLNGLQRMQAVSSLQENYRGVLTGKQKNIFRKANTETSMNTISGIMANVEKVPFDETDSALFNGSVTALRAMATNELVPASVRKKATVAMAAVTRKRKAHEKIVEADAYNPLKKSKRGIDKKTHRDVIDKIQKKYKDIPVEAEVELYKLYVEGKDKNYLPMNDTISANDDTITQNPYKINGGRALEIYNKAPAKFKAKMLFAIKRKKKSGVFTWNKNVTDQEAEKLYKNFKKGFDNYQDKVENFDSLEAAILNKYTSKVAER